MSGYSLGPGEASGLVKPGPGRAGDERAQAAPVRLQELALGKGSGKEFRDRPLPKLRSERMRPPARAVASRTRKCRKVGWPQSLCAAASPAMPPPTTSTRGPRVGRSVMPPLDSITPSPSVPACPCCSEAQSKKETGGRTEKRGGEEGGAGGGAGGVGRGG